MYGRRRFPRPQQRQRDRGDRLVRRAVLGRPSRTAATSSRSARARRGIGGSPGRGGCGESAHVPPPPLPPLLAALAATACLPATAAPQAPTPVGTLAYVKVNPKTFASALWVANLDGSGARRLVAGAQNPIVSPDGTRIAYYAGNPLPVLRVIGRSGGAPVTVARPASPATEHGGPGRHADRGGHRRGPEAPAAAPDRRRRRHRADARHGFFSGASFSPAGDAIVWSHAAKSAFPERNDLYKAPVAGGAPKRPDDRPQCDRAGVGTGGDRVRAGPQAGPQERLPEAEHRDDPAGRQRAAAAHARQPAVPARGPDALAWSADGRRLAAEYGGQDTSEAWRVDAVTGKAKDATGRFDGVYGAEISRDGTAILAHRLRRRGRRRRRRAVVGHGQAHGPRPAGDPAELEPLSGALAQRQPAPATVRTRAPPPTGRLVPGQRERRRRARPQPHERSDAVELVGEHAAGAAVLNGMFVPVNPERKPAAVRSARHRASTTRSAARRRQGPVRAVDDQPGVAPGRPAATAACAPPARSPTRAPRPRAGRDAALRHGRRRGAGGGGARLRRDAEPVAARRIGVRLGIPGRARHQERVLDGG